MSRLDVLNGSVSFHLFQHVVRVQSLGLLGVNGGRYIYIYIYNSHIIAQCTDDLKIVDLSFWVTVTF